jgi:hypothetical protein
VRSLAATTALAISISVAGASGADVAVFHSPGNDGVPPPTTPVVAPDGLHTLNLYLAATGTASGSGTVCRDADGEELCAFDLVILPFGGVDLVGFAPAAGVVHALDGTRLRLNQVDAFDGMLGPIPVGTLEIDTTGAAGGRVDLWEGDALDAGLSFLSIAPTTLTTVPEPSLLVGLAVGIPALLAMRRWRGRSR